MSKRPVNEPTRPPVRLRLPQISIQELKTIRVAIRRKDVPHDGVAGPLIRALENPKDLVLHKPGEGEKPIFDRDDIVVNLDFEERVVVTTPESPGTRSISKSEERQTSHSRSRRSRSHSPKRSQDKKYYSRSRSRSNEKTAHRGGSSTKEDTRSRTKSNFYRGNEHGHRGDKNDDYDPKPETSGVKRRRSSSKERRRSSSRDREHSKYHKSPSRSDSYRHYDSDRRSRRSPSPHRHDYRHRRYSRSPVHKRDATYRDHSRYSKSQERRSRSPAYRDRESKFREYRKRSRSPYSRERYRSPPHKEHREYSHSPPRYRGPPDGQKRHNPVPYQMPPHFGPPWPVYDPIPPYVRFVIPDGFIPAPPPRFPGSVPVRPRLPVRQLPIYNSRPIVKIKDTDGGTNSNTTNVSTPSASTVQTSTNTDKNVTPSTSEDSSKQESAKAVDTTNASNESSESLSVVTTTQDVVKTKD